MRNSQLALALDAEDRPHVVYDGPTGLTWAWRDAGTWISETVELGAPSPYPVPALLPALAMDSGGSPHTVAYLYAQTGDHSIVYVSRQNGAWQTEVIDTVPGISTALALAVDDGDIPHLAYIAASGELKVGQRTSSGWTFEVVDNTGSDPALALDDGGQPRVAYGDRYAYRDGQGWHIQVIDGVSGAARSLALGPAGRPHVLIGDGYDLGYATRFEFDHAVYLPVAWR